jgi:hypothetical protein
VPRLVICRPMKARLREKLCAEYWAGANPLSRPAGTRGTIRSIGGDLLDRHHCEGCKVGERRARKHGINPKHHVVKKPNNRHLFLP